MSELQLKADVVQVQRLQHGTVSCIEEQATLTPFLLRAAHFSCSPSDPLFFICNLVSEFTLVYAIALQLVSRKLLGVAVISRHCKLLFSLCCRFDTIQCVGHYLALSSSSSVTSQPH